MYGIESGNVVQSPVHNRMRLREHGNDGRFTKGLPHGSEERTTRGATMEDERREKEQGRKGPAL